MRRPLCPPRLAILLLLLAPFAARSARADEPPERKQLKAHPRGEVEIVLDGVLDEAAWAAAPAGTAFVERTPYPGSTPPVKTEFRVLYDAERLWIGVECEIGEGETPRALELQRDSFGIFNDDAISLKFDVRLDRRTTVGFVTNPAGTQLDYVAVENGDGFRREFDAIWDVATRVEEKRWVAEFVIPTIALGLPDASGRRVVALNVTRDHNARLATYDWAPMPAEFGPVAALYYGEITELDDVAGGSPVTLLPYALAGYATHRDPRWEAKVGGDARLRLGTDVWGELTILTDFAQVDLDDPVINLNRFALFFPERRPFFLSGIEVFEFGAPGLAQIFFTRRIGLDARGREVPLLGGLKTYGSVGDTRFGILQAVTGDNAEQPGQNFTVVRVRHNWGERGHLGAMTTLVGDLGVLGLDGPEGSRAFSPRWSAGVDGAVRALDRRLELSGFWSGSFDGQGEGGSVGQAGQAALRWRGEELMPTFSFTFISDDFDPAVGFVARPNLIQSRGSLGWITRPKSHGLQSVWVAATGMLEHAWDRDLRLGQLADAFVEVTWRKGYVANMNVSAVEDYVLDPFEVVPGRVVEPGRYRGMQFNAGARTPSGRNPVGNISVFHNSALFGGRLTSVRARGDVAFGPHVGLWAQGNLSFIDFPEEDTRRTFTLNGAVVVAPTTTLAMDFIYQVNAFEERGNALFRLRWRYLPGSDLFFVYREALTFGDDGLKSDRTVTLKLNYWLNAVL